LRRDCGWSAAIIGAHLIGSVTLTLAGIYLHARAHGPAGCGVNAVVLRLHMAESRRVHGMLLYEWLLERAKRLGLHGGSVFRAIAGYGRHGVLHDKQFFELEGELPVVIEFILPAAEVTQLLDLLRHESIDLVYSQWPLEFSATGVR
jgi:PII-like signaling protein